MQPIADVPNAYNKHINVKLFYVAHIYQQHLSFKHDGFLLNNLMMDVVRLFYCEIRIII